jgi:hypothetical protein
MVGETALTVMLLIGAGLLIKSFIQLQRIDLGVNPRHAVTANLLLSKRYLDPARREAFARQMLDSVAALPGVLDAAVHTDPPFLGGGSQETFTVEDVADPSPDRGHVAGFDVVSGNFFGAMGMPIVRGRDFETLDTATAPPVAMALLGTFAVIALIIATAGIYGLSTYAVVRRRQELGIRLALGATPGQILVLVIRHGMFLNLVGAALGLAAAMMLGKTVAGFLYGITATDAPTFLAVLLLFAAVALVATYLPARRAATIHPSLAFPT